ncbi:hypothetical protein HK101_006888, partial [Irineochytrium annulatum]
GSANLAQGILTVTFAIRGLVSPGTSEVATNKLAKALEYVCYLSTVWLVTDNTFYYLDGLIIEMLFIATGPAGLSPLYYFILSSVLFVGGIALTVAPGGMKLVNVVGLFVMALPVIGAFDVFMETIEQRFFALWEACCE